MSAHLPIGELVAAGLFPTRHREGLLLLVRAYFDDSGTHANSDVTVMGGLVGTVEQFERFEREWAARLDAPLPGKPPLQKGFHLSHCNARNGEFIDYSDAEQDAVIHDFRQIILDARLTSTALAIDRKAWDELIVGPYYNVLGNSITQCFADCIAEVARIVQPAFGRDKISIIFDRGIWSQRLQTIGEEWNYQAGIVSVAFASVSEVLPLQGADMVATENYWHAIDWLKRGDDALPRPLKHYLANMLHQGRILDREAIAAEVRRRGPDGRAPDDV
jgi:hypothetical protein